MKKLLLFIFITSSLTVFSKNWYLNDGSTTGDVYCTAIGKVSGTGLTPDSPKLFATGTTTTLKTLIASAAFSPGDVIFMDAMDVQIGSTGSDIAFNKALTIIGAGSTKTILKGPLSSSTVKFGVISSSNVVLKNFKCSSWSGASSGSASCLDIVANSSDLTGIILDGFWFDQNLGSGGDGACSISSSGAGNVTAIIKNILTTCNNNGSYSGGFTINGNGHKISFSSCFFNSNQRDSDGGAINIFGTNSSDGITTLVNIDKCSFRNNGSINNVTSANGGAISITGSKLIVTNCCFSNNIIGNTGQYGNAICGLKNSRISISNSTFTNNTGSRGQVSIFNNTPNTLITGGSYELVIDKCSFDNSALSTAKCIYYKPTSGTFSVNNCTFTSSGAATQIYSGVAWSLTNSAITSGTNPVLAGIAPSTINTIVPSSTPTPMCNGAISGDCSATTRTIDCSSDNLPPIIKGHDSTYVSNSTCTFTVPSYAAIDLCDASPTVTSVPSAGTALTSGATTPVLITATDATGNSSSITVYFTTPVCTSCVTLTSAAGTDNQSLCRNTSLTNITYTTKDSTSISNRGVSGANGLPPGVSATYHAGVITISGAPTKDGTYNYSIPLVGGTFNGQTVSGTITVNSLDNASFTYPSKSFCSIDANPNASLTGKVGGVFSSSPAGLSINPSTGLINLASSSSGTYEIKYTTNGQCPNVSTFPISIGSNPAVNAVIDQKGCEGENFRSINFTGSPGSVYQWTNSNPSIGLPASGTGDISEFIGKTIGIATITVTPYIGSCLGVQKTFSISVNPYITTMFPQLGPFCKDALIPDLPKTSSNGITGNWWPDIINNTATTTYSFDPLPNPHSGECATGVTMTIEVNNNVIPTVSIISSDPDYLICPGTSVTFTPTPIHGGTNPTYQWKLNSVNVVGASDGTYTNTNLQDGDKISVVMTSDLACVAPKTVTSNTITIRTGTNIAPYFAAKSAICYGESYVIPTTSVEGVLGTWNPATVDVTTSKEYEFTPNTVGCYGKAKVTLKVNPLPQMTSTVGNYGLCNNTPTDIQFTSSTLNTTFTWKIIQNNNVNGAIAGSGSSVKQSLQLVTNSIGTVEYVVTPMANNCAGTNDTIRLKVHPIVMPSVKIDVTNGIPINATKDTITLCQDDNVSFKAIPTNEGITPTYQWKINDEIVANSNYTYFSSTKIKNNDSISLIMISNQVCASPDTVYSNVIHAVVKINPLKITASPAKSCDKLDGAITLKGDAKGNIAWSKGSILLGESNDKSVSTSTPFVIDKLGPGSYNLSFKSQECTFTYKATITAPNIPKPATKIAWSKNAPICKGDSVELTALFTGTGVMPTSFLWVRKNNSVYDTISKTKANIWVKDPGVYGVKLVKSGCVSSRLDTTVTFKLNPTRPTKSLVTHPTCMQPTGSVTLGGLPIGGWKITSSPSLGGVNTGTAITAVLTNLNPATTYSIRVQNTTDGCFSDTTNVTIKQNVIAPSAPKFTIIQQPTCVVEVGSVLLSDLPKGKWTMTSTPATKTFTGNTLTKLVDSLKDNTTYTFVVKDSNGCASTASLPVAVNKFYGKPATPSGNTQQQFCTSSKPSISNLDSFGATSPVWYKDANSATTYQSSAALIHNGNYYLAQTVQGCESDRVLVTVKLNAGPKIPTLSPLTYCANVYAKGNDLITKLNLSPFPVRIFDGLLGGQSVDLSDTLQTKAYYVEADSALCYNEVRQKIQVKILPGTLPNLTTTTPAICTGSNITFADVSKEVGSASGLVWYGSKTGGAAIASTDKLMFPPISQTYYAAYKPNQAGACESKERIQVTITFVPTPTDVTINNYFYEPCKDAKETVANLPTAPYPSNTIAWFTSPTAFNPVKATDPLYTSKYYAASYIEDPVSKKKCYSTKKEVADVHVYEVAFIVHPENSVCEKNTGVLTIVEKDMHGYKPYKITVKDQNGNLIGNTLKTSNLAVGEYTIEVTDLKNCKQTVNEMIGCIVLNLPHVITPDDATGTNDRWKIHYYEKYPNVQVTIFNRWGSKVYTSAIPYMDDWDGRASSEIQTIGEGYLPAGTYYYVIDKGNGDAVESGYIELLK